MVGYAYGSASDADVTDQVDAMLQAMFKTDQVRYVNTAVQIAYAPGTMGLVTQQVQLPGDVLRSGRGLCLETVLALAWPLRRWACSR